MAHAYCNVCSVILATCYKFLCKRSLQKLEWLQISDTVYPMYKAYIEPDLKTAHLKIYNTFNPFSGFMDPTYILKSAQRVSKDVIHSLLQVGLSLCLESRLSPLLLNVR